MANDLHPLIVKADEILADRTRKYNSGIVRREDYWIYGASSIITELYRKVLTLISLDSSNQLTFEKAQNELPDIINYGCFLWDFLSARVNDPVTNSTVSPDLRIVLSETKSNGGTK